MESMKQYTMQRTGGIYIEDLSGVKRTKKIIFTMFV